MFTIGRFLDLGSPDAVRKALVRQVERGRIRHLARGLYDLPRRDPEVQPVEDPVLCSPYAEPDRYWARGLCLRVGPARPVERALRSSPKLG